MIYKPNIWFSVGVSPLLRKSDIQFSILKNIFNNTFQNNHKYIICNNSTITAPSYVVETACKTLTYINNSYFYEKKQIW